MIRFILVTFLFLGWAFYELSGGSAYQPEERTVAEAPPAGATDDGAEIVTRSVDATLASLAVPERLTQPLIEPPAATSPEVSAADVAAVIEQVAAAPAPEATAPALDLREVAGTRVNMRTGPGTDFGVVTTLDGGTRAEIIESDPSGWVKLRVLDTGLEGWMAERLLTPVEG